jgi:hypothetical protein
VVTLDRVVCCYPDPEALLGAAAAKTRQVLAFTYPRDRWYVRTMFAFGNFWLRLTVRCWNFAMRASSHGRSSAFSGRATLIEVPFRSVLRFFGHSLISNPEDDCAELLGEGDGAGTRRGMTRAQNNVSTLFLTSVFSVPKRQRSASKSLPLRGSLFGSRRHTPELSP